MHRKEQEITDLKEIEKIIGRALVCRVAINDKKYPYIVPMNFGYEENTLYLHSGQEGKKIDLLKQNPYICFEIDESSGLVKDDIACKWGIKYKSVIGYGKAEFVERFDEKEKALSIIMSQYSDENEFDFHPNAVFKTVIIRVDIDEITGKESDDE